MQENENLKTQNKFYSNQTTQMTGYFVQEKNMQLRAQDQNHANEMRKRETEQINAMTLLEKEKGQNMLIAMIKRPAHRALGEPKTTDGL